MKRIENLLNQVADPDNLRFAAWKAAKGKRYAEEVQVYFTKIDENVLKLHQHILSGDIDVGNYRYFTVYEPKERQICASTFSEQVLHHALMNICHPIFEKWQIFDSYASRKSKGTYAALAQAKAFSHSKQWFLKLDIRKFFASVHHDVLKLLSYFSFSHPIVAKKQATFHTKSKNRAGSLR
jgi:RNA-directed DNA polymerase